MKNLGLKFYNNLISVGRVTPCAPLSAFAAGRGSPQGGTDETVSKLTNDFE